MYISLTHVIPGDLITYHPYINNIFTKKILLSHQLICNPYLNLRDFNGQGFLYILYISHMQLIIFLDVFRRRECEWFFSPNAIQCLAFVVNWTLSVEKAMAPHSSTVAWKIPWMEQPGRLQSLGSLRADPTSLSLSLFTFMHWRRKWQPTPVFLPGESQGRGSLVGFHLWGRTESDTTETT